MYRLQRGSGLLQHVLLHVDDLDLSLLHLFVLRHKAKLGWSRVFWLHSILGVKGLKSHFRGVGSDFNIHDIFTYETVSAATLKQHCYHGDGAELTSDSSEVDLRSPGRDDV